MYFSFVPFFRINHSKIQLFIDFCEFFIILYVVFRNQVRSKVMYAIIQNGGKQYKVVEGKKVKLEKLTVNAGDDVQIKEVLVFNDGSNTVIGSPYIDGASVSGKIVSHGKNKKVIIFRYKRRKDSKTKKGHRQPYTEVLVEKISMEAPHGA